MSTHDRGAFGQLLAEAKALIPPRNDGAQILLFQVDLSATAEDPDRWIATAELPNDATCETGRTGEEALRRLVEKLRGS